MTSIQIADSNGVRRITLNRPQVHNAFDDGLIAELTLALGELMMVYSAYQIASDVIEGIVDMTLVLPDTALVNPLRLDQDDLRHFQERGFIKLLA